MKLDILTLKQATLAAFDHLDEMNIDSIEIKEDFYWHTDKTQLYDVYKSPENTTIGQLSFDVEKVEDIASKQISAVGYDFAVLASIFRYLGDEVP